MTQARLEFFAQSRPLSVGVAAEIASSSLKSGDNEFALDGVSAAIDVAPNTLTFVESKKHINNAMASAGAVICSPDIADDIPAGPAILVHDRPQAAFAQLVRFVYPDCERGLLLAHDLAASTKFAGAWISASAHLEDDVRVMPGAVIGANVQIGAGSMIGANCTIADGVRIGRNCILSSSIAVQCALIGDGVTIHPGTMIGQDGFGYFPGPSGLEKMPHIGRVIIQDKVEIGANSAVDRGTIGDTVIGEGTKIDNFVQVAHNVVIGRHVILCGHVALAGSCSIGDGAMLGGQAAVANGIHIGAGSQLAACSAIMNDLPAGQRWGGSPAQPIKQAFAEQVALRKLVKANKKS